MLLRMSSLFLRTLRDDPADAEVPSHRLLVRAGYIRRAAPGGFTWLPLGFRVFRNVERVVREEMDAMGAQEVHFPALLPREPYEATGRWTEYGDNLFRLKDRRGVRPPARPHPRGDVHAPGEGPVLVVQGPAALAVPDPDQVPGRGAAPGRADPRPRVHDEGQLLLRRRRRRAGPLLRRPPRRLHQDLRPARPGVRDRLGDVRGDGRLEERGVPAPDRRSARTPSSARPAATRPTSRPSPPSSRTSIPFDGLPEAHVEDTPDTPTIDTLVAVAQQLFPDAGYTAASTLKNVVVTPRAPRRHPRAADHRHPR